MKKERQSLAQRLTSAIEEINEAFTSPQNPTETVEQAQRTKINSLNEHIDWLLDNKKKLEAEIAQLKSEPKTSAEPAPVKVTALGAAKQLRQGPESARNAIILSEIISPPISKRSRDFSKRVRPTPKMRVIAASEPQSPA